MKQTLLAENNYMNLFERSLKTPMEYYSNDIYLCVFCSYPALSRDAERPDVVKNRV